MARTSAPHSATAQFFINAADNAFLDFKSETPQGWGYAVFGKVVKGSEVVDAIEQVRTGNRAGHSDVPLDDVTSPAPPSFPEPQRAWQRRAPRLRRCPSPRRRPPSPCADALAGGRLHQRPAPRREHARRLRRLGGAPAGTAAPTRSSSSATCSRSGSATTSPSATSRRAAPRSWAKRPGTGRSPSWPAIATSWSAMRCSSRSA